MVREPEADYRSLDPGSGDDVLSLTLEALENQWAALLNALRPRNLSLEALMRSCRPVNVEGDVVILGFDYDFHRGKVEEDHNRQDVEDALCELVGQRYRVRCVMAQQSEQGRAPVSTERPSPGSSPGAVAPTADQMIADDPVVRAAVRDLGAEIVELPGS
jgi:hypothetical protein